MEILATKKGKKKKSELLPIIPQADTHEDSLTHEHRHGQVLVLCVCSPIVMETQIASTTGAKGEPRKKSREEEEQGKELKDRSLVTSHRSCDTQSGT